MKQCFAVARSLGLIALLWLRPDQALANAYKILGVKSVKATGMGEAFMVQPDDPSAIAFNPAALAELDGLQLNLQGTFCNAYTEFHGDSGANDHINDQWQVVPSFFATHDLGLENIGFGFGVTVPNGLASEWDADSPVRYAATFSDLRVVDMTLALGVAVDEHLSLGVGLDRYLSSVVLRQMAPGFPPGAPDIVSEFEGDGAAWGFNLGASYRINDRHALALTYRHAYTVDYSGTHNLAGVGANMDTSIDFPAVVVAGYEFRPSEKWRLEFNLDWTNWEKVDRITVKTQNPFSPTPTIQSLQELNNTLAYKIGAEYAYSEHVTLRCGYIYNENATSEENWNPSQPDTDTHFLMTGLSYTLDALTLDAAVQFVYYETRDIENGGAGGTIDGSYRTWAPCFSLGMTYRF